MQSGSPAFGTPEYAMGILASAQMARHYNLPFRGGGALTSSKAPDAQAAYESMMCMWPTILGRVNFVLHAAGWLESALLASYEKFIIDVEQLRMFEWILSHGMPVDDEGLAMDALREVGPGGHFLGAEHTMRHYRTGFYRPWVSSTENFDRWQRFGSRTADVVAAERSRQGVDAARQGTINGPVAIASLAAEVLTLANELESSGNPNLWADATAAGVLAQAAAATAAMLVQVNLAADASGSARRPDAPGLAGGRGRARERSRGTARPSPPRTASGGRSAS